MKEILALDSSDSEYQIVEFSPEFTTPSAAVLAEPLSSLRSTLDDSAESLLIRGTFRLHQRLHPTRQLPLHVESHSINWGYCKQTAKVYSRRSDDDAYLRLRQLYAASQLHTSHKMLVIVPAKSNAPMDSAYFGPLSEADCRHLTAFVGLLKEHALSPLTLPRAETLLSSNNPWVAWLCLSILSERRLATPAHFLKAAASRAPADAESIVYDMFYDAMFELNPPRFGPLLLYDQFDPAMQEAMLKATRLLFVDGLCGATDLISLPEWQRRAKERVEEIREDATRAGVVRELESVIALKRK